MNLALLAFGANLGSPKRMFDLVLRSLEDLQQTSVVDQSRLYQTKPIGGPGSQPGFLNAAIKVETGLSASAIVQELLAIESALGRKRAERWNARTVDLDLLLLNDCVSWQTNCLVPHPRMTFRRFMLQPAVEIAPDWIHPICRQSLSCLFQQIELGINECVWIGEIPQGVTEICLQHGYALRRLEIRDLPTIASQPFSTRPKLLVWNDRSRGIYELPEQIIGPYLDLNSASGIQIEEELTAALKAIESL